MPTNKTIGGAPAIPAVFSEWGIIASIDGIGDDVRVKLRNISQQLFYKKARAHNYVAFLERFPPVRNIHLKNMFYEGSDNPRHFRETLEVTLEARSL